MKNNMKSLFGLRKQKAQGLVELAITIAVIAIITVTAFTPLGTQISNLLANAGPTTSAAYDADKGLTTLAEVVNNQGSVIFYGGDNPETPVAQSAFQSKIDVVNSLINGKDLTPDQVADLLEYLEGQSVNGVEVSGVMSKFLFEDLTQEELAALAESLGIDSSQLNLENAIAESLGIEDLVLELQEEALSAFKDVLNQKAQSNDASNEIKEFNNEFNSVYGNPKATIELLNQNATLISNEPDLFNLYVDLIDISK